MWAVLLLALLPTALGASDAVASAPAVAGQSPFEEAVVLYQQGRYAEAERAFLGMKAPSSTVFYNVGNACFKQGKLGYAILYWEKAARLDPLDDDCAGNLELASSLLHDATPPDDTPLPLKWVGVALFGLPVAYLETATVVLWCVSNIAVLLLLLWKSAPRVVKTIPRVTVCACVLAGLLLALNLYELRASRYAVLLTPREALRSGPGPQNTVLMEIHEGLKVKVLNEQGQWVAVKIAGGYSGWLPAGSIGII